MAQSKEEKPRELTPVKEEKPAAKKKKAKEPQEPQAIKDSPRHITIK